MSKKNQRQLKLDELIGYLKEILDEYDNLPVVAIQDCGGRPEPVKTVCVSCDGMSATAAING